MALRPGALLRGVVRTMSGLQPLADARVVLVDAAGNVVDTSATGPDGAYVFSDLDAGDYSVIASGYPAVTRTVSVQGGGLDDLDLDLAHRTS
ncbi:carboxypeptidase-like regulatory domain-containing protein [Streptomyces longispororuber]|uniref:carboxypeptidase-like regulatory domain-containing protein n=1 Tax=Streptomyces longispororuber TaxID=68230 RepID=UPI0035AC0B19